MTPFPRILLIGTLAGCIALPWPALADDSGARSALDAAVPGIPADAVPESAVDTAPRMFGVAAVGGEALKASRGGSEVVSLDINESNGTVRDNFASHLTTGNNVITEGSLAGASGFSTVIQNSGNNVLIQNSTIINLQVQ